MLGYRGTGKSVIAKILSKELGRKLYRMDDLIVQTAGKSIPEIVKQEGWPGFRKLESAVVGRVVGEAQDSVIDCGGGVVLDDNNMVLLKRANVFCSRRVCLRSSAGSKKTATGLACKKVSVLRKNRKKFLMIGMKNISLLRISFVIPAAEDREKRLVKSSLFLKNRGG
jgi:shikimate kinase